MEVTGTEWRFNRPIPSIAGAIVWVNRRYEVNTWFGFVAPHGAPQEIVARLNIGTYARLRLRFCNSYGSRR